MTWQAALLVAGGGALGSLARWAAVFAIGQRAGLGFPWGTLSVNLAGSLAIGFVAALARHGALGVTPEVRLFLAIGVLGGFTTFSSFSLEALGLLQRGLAGAALAYAAASVGLGLAAAWAGFAAARLLAPGA